jgi:NAD(P)H dehydrogenase (quinone)
MKHVIVVAHPGPDSSNLAMARAYQAAALRAGAQVVLRDLYRMGFDPRLAEAELPRPAGFEPGADVKAERALIADADVFVFVYPLWFDSPPAMLKGHDHEVGAASLAHKVVGVSPSILRHSHCTCDACARHVSTAAALAASSSWP